MNTLDIAPVAVLTALRSEAALIHDHLQIETTMKQFGSRYTIGRFHDLPVVVCEGGEGRDASSASAQALCCIYHPRTLIFSGIAGSISPRLQVGDVVLGKKLLLLETSLKIIAECDPWQREFASAPPLLDLAEHSAQQEGFVRVPSLAEENAHPALRDQPGAHHIPLVPRGEPSTLTRNSPAADRPRYMVGTITTSDNFNTNPDILAHTRQVLHGDCEEMEGAAAAQISAKNRVPFLAIRAISNPCGQTAEQLEGQAAVMRQSADVAGRVTLGVLAALADRPANWLGPVIPGTPGPGAQI